MQRTVASWGTSNTPLLHKYITICSYTAIRFTLLNLTVHTAHSVYTCIYNHRTIGANKGKKITEIKNQAKIKRKACRVPSHKSQYGRTSGLFWQEKKKNKLTNSTQKGSSWEGEESLPKPISRHISIGWARDQAGVCSGLQSTDDDNDDEDDSQVTETYSWHATDDVELRKISTVC